MANVRQNELSERSLDEISSHFVFCNVGKNVF